MFNARKCYPVALSTDDLLVVILCNLFMVNEFIELSRLQRALYETKVTSRHSKILSNLVFQQSLPDPISFDVINQFSILKSIGLIDEADSYPTRYREVYPGALNAILTTHSPAIQRDLFEVSSHVAYQISK